MLGPLSFSSAGVDESVRCKVEVLSSVLANKKGHKKKGAREIGGGSGMEG